jgi:hypothetical protein
VGHGQDDGIVAAVIWLLQHVEAVFVFGFFGVDPGIVDLDTGAVPLEFLHDVDHAGVAEVRAVLLEGQAEDQDARAVDGDVALGHQLGNLVSHVGAHVVVDAAAGQDHLGVKADLLRLVGQVVGIDADAVAAHQARFERQEVPFAAGGRKHFASVEAETREQHGQFVDQGDVDVALGVFDHFGSLGHTDAAGLVGAGGDDGAVQRVDEVGGLRGRAGGDLLDGGQAVDLVARVDALGAVADVEALLSG